MPTVGFADREAGVDQRQHRDPRLAVLGQQQIQQRLRDRPLRGGEEAEVVRRGEAGQHHPGGHVIPHIDLVQDVETRETSAALRGDRAGVRVAVGHEPSFPSRRSTAARRPIPPTREASSGANIGGPPSML